MKKILSKLLSIKRHLFPLSKSEKRGQNGEHKDKATKILAPELTHKLEAQSKVIDRLLSKASDGEDEEPCCHRRTTIAYSNSSIYRPQCSLPSKQTNDDTDSYACSRERSCCDRSELVDQSTTEVRERINHSPHHQSYRSNNNAGVSFNAIKSDRQSGSFELAKAGKPLYCADHPRRSPRQSSPSHSKSAGAESQPLDNEMNMRELVNTVRREISALVDADRKILTTQTNSSAASTIDPTLSKKKSASGKNMNQSATKRRKKRTRKGKKSAKKKPKVKKRGKGKRSKSTKSRTGRRTKSKKKRPTKSRKRGKVKERKKSRRQGKAKRSSKSSQPTKKMRTKERKTSRSTDVGPPPTEQCNNCCCNFLHYSLRQVMHDAEQTKQFALNMLMTGIDPSKLKDSSSSTCHGIAIPMYNCDSVGDPRFPMGPTFTTVSKNDRDAVVDDQRRKMSMVVQSVNTQRGRIQIKLDPQSFGLAPFFSEQYEAFIKGPPNSVFFTNDTKTFHK